MFYGMQVLWFDYCVQGFGGVEFYKDFDMICVDMIICKGYNLVIDSYFVFFENDQIMFMGFEGYFKMCGILDVMMVGLVMDFCVNFLVFDVVKFGFKVFVCMDLCCVIDLDGLFVVVIMVMEDVGVLLI